mmetsp:Transcript_8713/g.16214  ORF Transcript_8713/g.16214 Transcript_8713/m.16214 type:complete len:570 (-) Transcript_8713:97-1806(-)
MTSLARDVGGKVKERCALVVCDMQPDLLKAISTETRAAFLEAVRICIEGARKGGWLIIFTGLRFPPGYDGVSARHRLYGSFRRLNEKVGDKQAHWFMEGYAGAEIEPLLAPQEGDAVVWRQQHLPATELLDILRERGITKVSVSGLKAGYAVQATCQALCDEGLLVQVIPECVQDDVPERLAAMLSHLLPIYAEVISLPDWLDELGLDVSDVRDITEPITGQDKAGSEKLFYVTDCKRGFHGPRFCAYLLERPNWVAFPAQKWFQDERWQEFYCPLGKKIVDFADEPQFSRIAMYLKGRDWLEDKTKVMEIAQFCMPETFILEKGKWIGKAPLPDNEVPNAPWFVKEANRNWGASVMCCLRPSQCVDLTKPDSTYVVQQHVPDPLLMDDGRKCHIKFYVLLSCTGDAQWDLYTYSDGYLSISPNKWTPEDLSAETQVTILRSERISNIQGWSAWPKAYPKCKACVAKAINNAVQESKLEARPGQKQFEIFSADFMVDTKGEVWLFEFNMSPVLKDEGDSPTVNDSALIRDALSIVLPWEQSSPGLWDFAGRFAKASAPGSAGEGYPTPA